MRILLCSHDPLDRRLGAPKVLIELADALGAAGASVDLVQPSDFGAPVGQDADSRIKLIHRLREFLQHRAPDYDVLDYDHVDLPFERDHFDPRALLVARSVLLAHHLESIDIPQPRTARALAGRVLHGRRRRELATQHIEYATRTIHAADLVNVSNDHDKAELLRRGIDPDKIVVLPFGLADKRRRQFEQVCTLQPPAESNVAFVGTFDYRKGALDFARIARRLFDSIPNARLKLIGTAGLVPTAAHVLECFGPDLRSRIDVVPRFEPDDLPALLADCSVGVFPSYYEGFPFGVLEMLAAAIPVFAYDAPGAPMMLPPQQLVPPGDGEALAGKVVALLHDPGRLAQSRRTARQIAARFDWNDIAQATLQTYDERLGRTRERLT